MRKTCETNSKRWKLFFAFLDGVFTYSCPDCSALCCRGQGLGGNLDREMGQLLSLYPALGHSITGQRGKVAYFASPAGACYFLDSDKLCRIEKEHGKTLKPGICSLFPFNNLMFLGDTVAVLPHFLCPLRMVLPAHSQEVAGRHAILRKAVQESGLLEGTPPSFHDAEQEKFQKTLARESSFLEACSKSIGSASFLDFLNSAAQLPLGAFLEKTASILGFALQSSKRDGLDDLLFALATPLRMNMTDLEDQDVLRVLALASLYLRELSELSTSPLSLQGAFQVIQAKLPVFRMLAAPSRLYQPSSEAPIQGLDDPKLKLMAAAVIFSQRRNEKDFLSILEGELRPEHPVAERALLLQQLAHYYSGPRTRNHK